MSITHKSKAKGSRTIVVVEGGWVFLTDNLVGNESVYTLNDASVIRVWGTTAGLGEIALKGPTTETVLDFCGNPTVPKNKVLVMIPCTYGA
jgi:hypothetical protein